MELSYAEGWRPEEGDTLIGRVTEVATGRSQFGGGGKYPIITVQPEEGAPVAVHCFHAALKARVLDLKPMPGERIGVKFVGKRPHKTDPSLTVADYIVKVEGRTTTDAYAGMEEPAAPRTDVPVNPQDFAPASPASQAQADDDIPF